MKRKTMEHLDQAAALLERATRDTEPVQDALLLAYIAQVHIELARALEGPQEGAQPARGPRPGFPPPATAGARR